MSAYVPGRGFRSFFKSFFCIGQISLEQHNFKGSVLVPFTDQSHRAVINLTSLVAVVIQCKNILIIHFFLALVRET